MAEVTKQEQLIFEIAKMEWEMFQHVYNTGGRASCQDDPETFFRMRMSQWMVYSEDVLQSYLEDCKEAVATGKNLIFEKYARMMETTYPEEYAKLTPYLKEIGKEVSDLVEKIVKMHLEWDKQVMERFPKVRGRGRAFTTSEDNVVSGSSMESYLRAELLTYSPNTIRMIYEENETAYKKGDNLLEKIIANETAFYGYESLEAAESKM